MELQAKRKSLWSTFKNAYLRSTNVKKFWNKLNKDKIPPDLINTFNLYLNSESYNWSSKCWKHLTMNHLNLMIDNNKNYENKISQEYFTFTYFNDPLIKDAWKKIQDKKIKVNVDLFKKQNGFSLTKSINHNLILMLLYENI